MEIPAPKSLVNAKDLEIDPLFMMSPGPTNCSVRVLNSLALPILGPFHPSVFQLMDEVKEGLQYIFQTKNQLTFCISGSGTAGMEAGLVNIVEPGEVVLVCITGTWGEKASYIAKCLGANVHELKPKKYGDALTYDEIKNAIKFHRPTTVFIVHADSSTGVYQNIEGLGPLCRKYNAILIVDAVASVGGMKVKTDEWECDYVYGGAQKCLSAVVGLTPITMNMRCLNKIELRKTRIPSYYLDLKLIANYWNCFPYQVRKYHHTMCSSLLFALREALCQICTEGLENVINRHTDAANYLRQRLTEEKFEFFVENPLERLTTVTSIKIPLNCDQLAVTKYAMTHYGLEISGGIGPTIGLIFRIGLMGTNANRASVDKFMKVFLETIEKLKATV